MEMTFFLSHAWRIPENVTLVVAELPAALPLAETISFCFSIMPQVLEFPWRIDTHSPWLNFDGFLSLRGIRCHFLLRMVGLNCFGGSPPSTAIPYDSFAAFMRATLPRLRAASLFTFIRDDTLLGPR
jgi:hypothetical protein